MRAALKTKYERVLNVLTELILDEAASGCLKPLANLDFEAIRSAWDVSTASDPQSHTQGKISKTCFVFMSHIGWDWSPYQATPPQVGALAQIITGELGLRCEEITCDAALPQKLKETNENDVPTVLLGDPACLASDRYAEPMREYDSQYLLNCGVLMAWQPHHKGEIETHPDWIHLKTRVFKQKVENPPPNHHWRSVFSHDDLNLKMRTVIEQLRSRLLNLLMSDPNKSKALRKAEDPTIAKNAAALGIDTSSLSHLESPSR